MATENATAAARAPRVWRTSVGVGYRGSMEQLVRVGIPSAWLANLPVLGKKRGCRTLYADGQQVHVSVGERGVFSVQTIQQVDAQDAARRYGALFAVFLARALSKHAED